MPNKKSSSTNSTVSTKSIVNSTNLNFPLTTTIPITIIVHKPVPPTKCRQFKSRITKKTTTFLKNKRKTQNICRAGKQLPVLMIYSHPTRRRSSQKIEIRYIKLIIFSNTIRTLFICKLSWEDVFIILTYTQNHYLINLLSSLIYF